MTRIWFRDIEYDETLSINTKTRKIKTDFTDIEYRYDNMIGDYLKLLRGRNLIKVDGNCLIKFKYRYVFL